MKNDKRKNKSANLRGRSRALLKPEVLQNTDLTPCEIHKIIQDLHTYQIELELQNEELRRALVELENSRQKYADLYDFAPVGYLTMSDKGVIAEANLIAAEILGIARRDLIKQSISTFIVPEDQDIYYHNRKVLLESRTKQSCELRLQKKNGLVFYGQLDTSVNSEVHASPGQFRIILTDISTRKKLETKLKDFQTELEKQVIVRTSQLSGTIKKLKSTLSLVQTRENELKEKNKELLDINTTLDVMLKRRDKEHNEIRGKIAAQMTEMVLPFLRKSQLKLTGSAKDYLETAQINLINILTNNSTDNLLQYSKLAPRELQVVNYIKQNKSSKEIADLLGLSIRTIGFYRANIRKKIGIKNQKKNLKKHITSLP